MLRHFISGDHFLYSRDLCVSQRSDILGRILKLVTIGSFSLLPHERGLVAAHSSCEFAFYLIESFLIPCRLCGFEPFYDERGDQAMFQRILKCDYEFVTPWWDEVSENAKVGDTSSSWSFCYNWKLILTVTPLTNITAYH